MNMQNEAILKELIELESKWHLTGRNNYKRISELQQKLVINSAETAKRAIEQANRALEQTDTMLRKYARLEEVNVQLIEENALYYFALAEHLPEMRMHHC